MSRWIDRHAERIVLVICLGGSALILAVTAYGYRRYGP